MKIVWRISVSSLMPTYKEQQVLEKVCKVTRQKQIKYYDFIPFFDFQYEKIIFNCQPSHFSPCSAVPGPWIIHYQDISTLFSCSFCLYFCVTRYMADAYCAINPVICLRVCPWENQAGGDNAQITDFAQTWHNWWVWWDINRDKKYGRNIEFPGI